jgi:hypothetical protein
LLNFYLPPNPIDEYLQLVTNLIKKKSETKVNFISDFYWFFQFANGRTNAMGLFLTSTMELAVMTRDRSVTEGEISARALLLYRISQSECKQTKRVRRRVFALAWLM